jgi:hypothetical protein
MANPEVDRLIQELSQILEQNRQKRNAADAMLLGIQQGKERAAQQQQAPAAPAQQVVATPQAKPDNGLGKLSPNYRKNSKDGGFEQAYQNAQFDQEFAKTPGNAPPQSLDVNDAIAQEQRKRLAQQYAVAHGQPGPLGSAGTPAPAEKPLVPTPDLGPSATYPKYAPGQVESPGAPAMAAPPGMPPKDYALLDALSQRYISPEELARR